MSDTSTESAASPEGDAKPIWIRLWPFYIIIIGLVAAWYFGLFDVLSVDFLRERHESLRSFVEANFILAVLAYVVIYALATLFVIPGALWITIAGGLLFGLVGGTIATTVGATAGASMLFFAAKTSLGSALRRWAGKYAEKLEGEFQNNALSYMFAMRFVPAMPFPIANIVPALLGAKYRDYLLTTALGIIPGVIAYTWLGVGLNKTFAAGEEPDLSSVFWNFFPAAIALLIVSLIPVIYKKIAGRKADVLKKAAS